MQFLASLVRNYFGDGEEFGMSLQYATEDNPLGTAGSVKNAEAALRDEPFLVISGDALTDIDLTELVEFHKDNSALVTVGLTRVPDPLEFGIVIIDDDGRIQRFLEKPTWGQVFSDTVNTGIYVMEPEVLDDVAAGEVGGLVAATCSRSCSSAARRSTATSPTATGRTSARTRATSRRRPTCWPAGSTPRSTASRCRRASGWPKAPRSTRTRCSPGRSCIGDYAKIEAGAQLREFTVVGSNVVVKEGAFLHRAVVHNNVYVGRGANLRGCVIGKNTDVMRAARIEEGAVVGDECVIEAEAYLSAGVKVYPFKTIEAGAVVNTSVIWESRGPAHPVRPARGVRPRQRRDHPGAVRPAGERLRDHAEEGRDGHHLP